MEQQSSWVLREVRQRLKDFEQGVDSTTRHGLPRLVDGVRRAISTRCAWLRADRLIRGGGVEDLSGQWKLEEREGMEVFLQSMGFNALQRATAARAGQVQVIQKRGHNLHITTCDIRGTFELVLPLGGPAVLDTAADSKAPISRTAFVDGGDIVITESVAGERQPFTVCRRSLTDDGKMCVDVQRRACDSSEYVSMRVIFTRRSTVSIQPEGTADADR